MKHSLLIICILTLILLISGCISSNSGDKANNTNYSLNANISQIPNSNYSLYTNDNISIRYPSNWTLSEGGTDYIGNEAMVKFYPPNINQSNFYPPNVTQSNVSICYLQISYFNGGLSLDDSLYWGFIRGFTMGPIGGSDRIIGNKSLTTLAGYPAYTINFSGVVDNTTIRNLVILNNVTATRKYAIEYTASEEYYNKYMDNAQYMIDSFNISNT